MKETPILFSAPMVQRLVNRDNPKTQTRRIIKDTGLYAIDEKIHGVEISSRNRIALAAHCPYGQPGDRLIVKEATWQWCKKVPNGTTKTGRKKYSYRLHGGVDTGSVIYCADHPQKPVKEPHTEPEMVWKYKSGRYMQRHLVRIILEITATGVQRLQEISEEDAEAEGAMGWWNSLTRIQQEEIYSGGRGPVGAFLDLWDSINGSTHPWANNDWVFALSFKRVKA
jgi:hypothetical protein